MLTDDTIDRIRAIVHAHPDLSKELEDVKARISAVEVKQAVDEERYRSMDEKLDGISGTQSKLAWLVFGTLLSAVGSAVVGVMVALLVKP